MNILHPRWVVSVTCVMWLTACAPDKAPVDVTLENLAAMPPAWNGRMVRTEGVVRTFEQPRHYWIEDDAYNRVGLEPQGEIAAYVGEHVRVVGRFNFVAGQGRQIMLDSVVVVRP